MNYIGNSPSSLGALDAMIARLVAIETQLAAAVLVRRLWVGTVAGGVVTPVRTFGGITVARTGAGLFTVTFSPAEANALYSVQFTAASTPQSAGTPSNLWNNYVSSTLAVGGFNFETSIWSTTRTLADPTGVSIAIL